MSRKRGVWSELMRGSSFLWKKFFFFFAVGAVLVAGGMYVHPVQRIVALVDGLQVSADQPSQVASTQTSPQSNLSIDLAVTEQGVVSQDGHSTQTRVTPSGQYDELRYVVFDGENKRPSKVFYDKITITVELPKAIDRATLPVSRRRLITAHGVGATSESRFTDNKTLVFEATDVVQTAIVTVLIDFPKGYFSLGTLSEAQRVIWDIPGNVWLGMSIVLPLLGLMILINVYRHTTGENLNNPPNFMAETPPDNLSPALVGVLAHSRIRAKELLAAVLDLANRGYLGIEDRDGQMLIYKKNIRSDDWQKLRSYEKTLIDEFFGRNKTMNTAESIEAKESKDLFSQKVTRIYEQMYNEISNMGFFSSNPAAVHWKYRLYGIGLFILGIAGFVYAMFTSADPKFTLFLWAGLAAAGLVIIFFAARISARTTKGKNELVKWLAFRNYLSLNRGANIKSIQSENFEHFLPFAVALDVEYEWAKRFSVVDFRLPRWYGASINILNMQDFANSFFPLLGRFTQKLSFLKEPVIE